MRKLMVIFQKDAKNDGYAYRVRKLFTHPSYREKKYHDFDYDVGIIEMKKSIEHPDYEAITLIEPHVDLCDDTYMTLTGYKGDDFGLYLVFVPKVSEASCYNSYLYLNGVTPRMVCAGKNGTDSCRVRTESEYYNEGGLLFKAKEFLLHPRFSEIEWECDVAIIKLESRLRYNKKCQPIELPRVNEEICDGLLFLLSGYGRTDAQAPHRDAKLRAVAVPAFNNGDSGGPLVRNGVQYGIVSHGLGCAPPLYPGIYARIAAPLIREWITNITGLL
uniref:Uncharacterized protein n=1 Tax=Phlebotomus papatasi TaxID=29031 RepID=A0A1B0EXM2_PHLPP